MKELFLSLLLVTICTVYPAENMPSDGNAQSYWEQVLSPMIDTNMTLFVTKGNSVSRDNWNEYKETLKDELHYTDMTIETSSTPFNEAMRHYQELITKEGLAKQEDGLEEPGSPYHSDASDNESYDSHRDTGIPWNRCDRY